MNLALACGNPSPSAMLRGMRPRELGLWAALWSIDPWGEERADLRAGIITSVIAETHRNRKSRSAPFKPSEFMPYLERVLDDHVELSRKLRAALTAAGQHKPRSTH